MTKPLKSFVIDEASRRGVTPGTVYLHIRLGLYANNAKPEPNTPMDGEIPMKSFAQREAERLGIKPQSVYIRIARGFYPNLQRRYVNSRVVMVRV